MRALLRNRDARLFLGAQGFSQFGDSAMFLVTGIWTKTLTDSNSAAGLVFFVLAAPSLFAPLGGLLADRVRRRPLLIVTNLVTAAVVAALLLVHDRGELWLIYAVTFVYGGSRSLISAGQSALTAEILPKELLAAGNSLLQTITQTLRLLSPLAGAGLFAAFGARPVILLDIFTFLVAAVALLALRHRGEKPAPGQEPRWLNDVLAGIRHLRRVRILWDIMVAVAASMLVLGFAETIIFAVVGSGLHRPPAFLGVLSAAQGVGATIGGLTAIFIVRKVGDALGSAVGLAGFALGDLLFILPSTPVVVLGFTIAGLSNTWLIVSAITALQRRTPNDLQGRAYAAADAISSVPLTISIAIGAGVILVLDYRIMLVIMAAVTCLVAARLAVRSEAAKIVGDTGEPRAREVAATESDE